MTFVCEASRDTVALWRRWMRLAAPVPGTNASATLQDVCYKPLGDDCATQSILQVGAWPVLSSSAALH